MRILAISNLYPPHHIGGYELGCREVMERLAARGHDCAVLTSSYGLDVPRQEGEVRRWLVHDLQWAGSPQRAPLAWLRRAFQVERTNRRAFRRTVAEFRPDVVYLWNPTGISLSVALQARRHGIPAVYFVSDEWITRPSEQQAWRAFWERRPVSLAGRAGRPALRGVASLLGVPTGERLMDGEGGLDWTHVQFASRYLLEKAAASSVGGPYSDWTVSHWGVDTTHFVPANRSTSTPTRVLYVGQLVPHKGVHTAVEAMRVLRDDYGLSALHLDVVGGSTQPEYVEHLRSLIARAQLEPIVHLAGAVSRQQLPDSYRAHDILIFPSEWNEPFSITLLEGMASGLAVVGTPTGGSAEILRHDENALVYETGDARAAADAIARISRNPGLATRLGDRARATVVGDFTMDRMVARAEDALTRAVAGGT